VRRGRIDAGQTETASDGRRDRDRTIRRDSEDSTYLMASCQLDDLIDLAEVKGLRNIGIEKADGIGVGVNRDHAKTEVPRASNRIDLGNARAEEEHAGQLAVRLRGSC
jgi:hypothetical protein